MTRFVWSESERRDTVAPDTLVRDVFVRAIRVSFLSVALTNKDGNSCRGVQDEVLARFCEEIALGGIEIEHGFHFLPEWIVERDGHPGPHSFMSS